MKVFVLLVSVLSIAQALKLPKYFTKCSISNPELSACLLKNAKEAWPTLLKGDNHYHIQPLGMLRIPYVHYDVNGHLQGNMSGFTITGLEGAEMKEIRIDLEKKRFDLKYFIPTLSIVGDYALDGTVLTLPIQGTGIANLTFGKLAFTTNSGAIVARFTKAEFEFAVNMDNEQFIEFELVDKAGKQYIDIKKNGLKYTVTRAYFKLGNLFEGDETLASAIRTVLDESWEAINEEIDDTVGNTVGTIFTQVLQSFFKRISINELFSE